MIMYTVFESNPLSGKTLVPFSTHAGSGLSGFDRSLAAAYPECTIAKGLAIAGTDAQNNPDKVRVTVTSWLSELGLASLQLSPSTGFMHSSSGRSRLICFCVFLLPFLTIPKRASSFSLTICLLWFFSRCWDFCSFNGSERRLGIEVFVE